MSSPSPYAAPNFNRNIYISSPQGGFPGVSPGQVQVRISQGFPVRPDIAMITRPSIPQQPVQQPPAAQSGGSIWPWALAGALGLGGIYLGYKWMSKSKDAAEKIEEEAADATVKGEEAATKEAATAVGDTVASEGSKVTKVAEEAVEAVEHKVSEVVEKGAKEAPSMISRIGNTLSHKAVLIPAGLAAAAAAEYAYPVARPLVRAYGPVAMEYAGRSPELLGKLFQGAKQTIGNAIMNFRYSGADVCKVPAQKTLETLSQAVPAICKPGEEPLTYLASQKASSLWNWGAATVSALAARTGLIGSSVGKEGVEKLGQSAVNGTVCAVGSQAEHLGQCGLNDAPFLHKAQQNFGIAMDYVGGKINSGLGQANTFIGNLRGVDGAASSIGKVANETLPALSEVATAAGEVAPTITKDVAVWLSPTEALKMAAKTTKLPTCPVGSGPKQSPWSPTSTLKNLFTSPAQ